MTMWKKRKTDWKLLARYLAGETNAEENLFVDSWLAKDSKNRLLMNEILVYWKNLDQMKSRFDVDNAWNKLQARISEETENKHALEFPLIQHKEKGRKLFLRLAAAVVTLSLLTFGATALVNRANRVTVVAGFDEARKQIVLPDKTVVTLNTRSRISYNKKFNRNPREVSLAGEAFFEVAPDASRPFVVSARQARVRVAGTSFNVEADHADRHVEVFVLTGLVELSSAQNRQGKVLLKPGDMGILNRSAGLTRETGNENCIAWKTGKLVFADTRLDDVRDILNDVYGVAIEFRQPRLDSTRINGNYSNDSLDQILQVICTQNHLKIEKSENIIYLSE